jgi:hypothetical protein
MPRASKRPTETSRAWRAAFESWETASPIAVAIA